MGGTANSLFQKEVLISALFGYYLIIRRNHQAGKVKRSSKRSKIRQTCYKSASVHEVLNSSAISYKVINDIEFSQASLGVFKYAVIIISW